MKNKSKFLNAVMLVLIIAVLVLGGYIVYDKVIKTDNKISNTENNKCTLINFDNYILTTSDKTQIANIINNQEAMGTCKIDKTSIKIEKTYGKYAHLSANTKCNNQAYDQLQILAYKLNNEFKIYTYGSGWTNGDIENLEQLLENTCK